MPPLLTLLADLVRRPSVNPMGRTDIPSDLTLEHRVTDYLEPLLRELGVPVRRQPVAPGRENLIAEFRTGSPVTLLWEAHQDTVPTDGMVIDPFAAAVRDGKLYGRGACDVKAGVACMFAAFARLVAEKPAGAANVILAYSVDEEHTFLGVQALMKEVRADFAVVAEPTELNLVTAHKGVVRWRLHTSGRACHSSRPDQGVNAVYAAARVVSAIEAYADELAKRPPHPLLGPPTVCVGRVTGGVSPNTVPDACVIDVDRRLLPGETAAEVEADLLAFAAARAGVPVRAEMTLDCPSLPPVADAHPQLARLSAAVEAVTGRPPRIDAVPYGTDASSVAAAGVPAVVFGPGSITQAHTDDEWVEIVQVERAADILFRFACGAA